MKIKIIIIALAVLIVGFVNPSFSYDHVRYVDVTNGLDTNDGLSAGSGAWKHLFTAVEEINIDSSILAGETIILYVAPGTYPADMAIAPSKKITITKSDLTIMGSDSATTILDGTDSDSAYWYNGIEVQSGAGNVIIKNIRITNFLGGGRSGIRFNSGTGCKIENCEIEGLDYGIYIYGISIENSPAIYGNNIVSGTGTYGIYLNASSSLVSPEIKGNSISQYGSAGIYISTGTSEANPIIRENSIFNNMRGVQVQIGAAASSPQIISNRIYDNQNGVEFIGGGLASSQPEIINNVIYQDAGTMVNGIILNAISTDSIINAKIYHNTIDGGTDNGIYSDGGSGSVTAEIKYSIITNFTGGGSSYGIFNGSNSTLDIDYVDVWNNATGNFLNCSATNSISADPQYASDYSIAVTSPCVAQVLAAAGDPVDYDIIGTSRPRKKDSAGTNLHDIGAYEYPYQSYDFTMPGGAGIATDYRLLTLPVQLAESSLSTLLTTAYGVYDDEKWRAFAWNGSAYVELGTTSFDTLTYNTTLSSHAGRSFWVISLDGALTSDTTTFEGVLTGNKQPQFITLAIGWNMVALPWPASTANPSIELGNIVVADDTNKFWLTSANNTLTETAVWDYTGAGGYTKLEFATDVMVPGKGYWINVSSASPVDLVFPPDNSVHLTAAKRVAHKSKTSSESPPAPPGSSLLAEGDNGCFVDTCFTK